MFNLSRINYKQYTGSMIVLIVVLIVVLILLALVCLPALLIWCISTLLGTTMVFNFKTWLAALFIILFIGFS